MSNRIFGITTPETFCLYDLTDYRTNEAYKKLDGLERFFAYQLLDFEKKSEHKWNRYDNGEIVFRNSYLQFAHYNADGVFEGVVTHPDTHCLFLDEIYISLWDDQVLQHCRKGTRITCDTMNSVCRTLNIAIGCIETEKTAHEEFRKSYPQQRKNITMGYLLNRFYDTNGQLRETLAGNKELIRFVDVYHTLGNFIPFPSGCNAARASARTKDYWDLTLKYIYDYYHNTENVHSEPYTDAICGYGEASYHLKKWLDEFGDWDTFVEKNYMSAFVNKNEDGTYGEPIELWEGHFSGSVLPESLEECNEYFSKATICILRRGLEMAEKLFEKRKRDQ